ncbi:helix-turn-helix domain-containing protein [Actinophytocola sediminis]
MQVKGTPRYYRVKAVAEMFDVSPSTIYRAIEAGQLTAIRIGGSVRVPASAVALFELECALDETDVAGLSADESGEVA